MGQETAKATLKQGIPLCEAIGQLGGTAEGLTGRIKDFEILKLQGLQSLLVITGSSDGAIRLWLLDEPELTDGKSVADTSLQDIVGNPTNGTANGETNDAKEAVAQLSATTQVGTLLGTYEAGNRITCLKAFIMSGPEYSKEKVLANGSNGHLTDSFAEEDQEEEDN